MRGNFGNYYGFRDKDFVLDPRVLIFDKSWCQGKRLLDIGCNSGRLTIEIGLLGDPEHICGIDIDPHLIRLARRNLQIKSSCFFNGTVNYFPQSCPSDFGILFSRALSNISFRCGDWINEPIDSNSKMDIIIAFSVTKWIQLDCGDSGIRLFLEKCYMQLTDDGILVLEPQDFSSYKNCAEFQLGPAEFDNYLVETLNFKRIESPSKTWRDEYNPFNRKILFYQK